MYIQLFATCIPVKGYSRSLICDLSRKRFRLIPNILFEILTEHEGRSKNEIIKYYGEDAKDYIEEYFNFLIENQFAFECTKKEINLFPKIDLTYQNAGEISNFILDISTQSNHDYHQIFDQVYQLGCVNVQIRIFNPIEKANLIALMDCTKQKNLRSVHLTLPYHDSLDKEFLLNIHIEYPVSQIDIHSTPEDKIRSLRKVRHKYYPIYYFTQKISDETHCGNIEPEYFTPDLLAFSESKSCNNCLNKKASIDRYGNIKNCPSMQRSFGTLGTTTLPDAVQQVEFRVLWGITKDNIDGCRDCEFRYICTDCRAYINEPENLLSKPAKCNYDPYTATWATEPQ